MKRDRPLAGGCLCGAVRYEVKSEALMTLHCCCEDCRRIGSGGHATLTVVSREDFSVTGDLTAYARISDSGNEIVRYFYPTCGSAIHHTRAGAPKFALIRVTSLDEPESVKPESVIFASRKLSWDHLAPDLKLFADEFA